MKSLYVCLSLTLVLAGTADAKEVVFTVGKNKKAGKAAASNGGKWSKSLKKGLKRVSKKLAEMKPVTVVLKVAAGTYSGDLGSGAYALPSLRNPKATLRIEGGYSADFSKRDPFHTPSWIQTVEDRSMPLLNFYNSRHPRRDQDVLARLTIDGFVMDVTNSNNYDAKNNNLLKGSKTSTWPIIRFRNLQVDHLTIQNCVFLNSPHRAFETLVRPASKKSTVRLYNSIFLNCVIPVRLSSCLTKGKRHAKIVVDHCSFLLNWAYNPDVSTGNPCALEVGSKTELDKVVVTNNLFYSNFGGGILALHLRMPEMIVNNNNFVGNGLLHKQLKAGAVAMVAAAGGKKMPISVDMIEELDFIDEAEGNVSINPGIALALEKVTTVKASKIKPKENWSNAARRLLGKNLQGGKVAIKNYAPRKAYDPKRPPFPTNPKARRYGASPSRVK